VTNIYSSECNRPLRANHNGKTSLASNLTNEDKYYQYFKSQIDRFVGEMPALCNELSKVTARFNPLRAASKAH
jgi:hypothetical protein